MEALGGSNEISSGCGEGTAIVGQLSVRPA
jgi:hypothetical protein